MNEWLEVSVQVDHETAEAVAEVLSRYTRRGVVIEAGPEGWETEPVIVRGYLPANDELWSMRQKVEEGLWHLGQIRPIPEPSFRRIAEEDWSEAWRKQLKVLRIGERVVIRPSWLDHVPEPEDVIIELDPGMAFGTGLHPTTQLCLCALERLVRPGIKVLDLGTGSGILAIAAAKLGAGHVAAFDNDEQAVQVARGNVAQNGVTDDVKVRKGSLGEVTGRYDLVVVNILARVVTEMARAGLAERLRPGGMVVAAGITVDQAPEVVAALEENGLELTDQRQRDDWVSLQARRTAA